MRGGVLGVGSLKTRAGIFVLQTLNFYLLTFGFLFCLPGSALSAKDLAAYRAGDMADEDIVTPVPLDVVDTAATAALQSARADQFPAVFRRLTEATNVLTGEFLAAAAQARSNFLADVQIEFHAATLDDATIAAADFGRLVTVFGVENKSFAITEDLAAEWARGHDGRLIQEKLLAALLHTANRHICPDALPREITVGETIRLVAVTGADEKLSFERVQRGELVRATNVISLSEARAQFRRGFPVAQQLFARSLAEFLQPNCLPDAPFTQLTRGAAVYRMVVSDHYDAGDAIARRSEKIDVKTLAALLALKEKSIGNVPVPAAIAAKSPPMAEPAPHAAPAPKIAWSNPPPPPATQTRARHVGLIAALAGISLAAFAAAGWLFFRNRTRPTVLTAEGSGALLLPGVARADLTPQVAHAVREAVQQELAAQRRELLRAQQAATDEIAALVQRLDELQVPMQQRLQTYEERIKLLEGELAVRNEENRELLKLKIEMISRQLAAERATTVTKTMTA